MALKGAALIVALVSISALPAFAASTEALLAVSWQPAFCEKRPGKTECRSQTADHYDATHFSLHGLWPMGKNYCGVSSSKRSKDISGNWKALPALPLDPSTRAALDAVMPGTQSALQRHEWIKHGTCSAMSPERYYARSVSLMNDLNRSAVVSLFSANIGKHLSSNEIIAAFIEAFGPGAARRVKMKCHKDDDGITLISELTIGLGAGYANEKSLGDLIQSAGGASFGCRGGIVDAAGIQ